jgi:hypothetical protein
MNDFQMSSLANDRINSMRAEADRQRLARSGQSTTQRSRSARPRRLALSLPFRRATAF